MPASARPCALEPRRARSFRNDDASVTEVVGQILAFGILSTVFVLSVLAFQQAEDRVQTRAALLEAQAIAQQVQGVAVEASLFIEGQGSDATYRRDLRFSESLEGRVYDIFLEESAGGNPDRVRVVLAGLETETTASLFAASAPSGVDICDSTVIGGPVAVRYGVGPEPTACLYLESIP